MSDAAISSAGKVAVVGAGAFGTALAATIARAAAPRSCS